MFVEMAETWELDLDQWLDIVGAWWGHEIDATDFGALFNELCDGTYEAGHLERRKLLNCKNWYSISRTVLDNHAHCGNADDCSVALSGQAPRLRRAAMRRWGLTAQRDRAKGTPCRKCVPDDARQY